MNKSSASADAEAYRLMRAGRLAEALTFARQAVAAKSTCSPAHGVLAMILLRLGRAAEADAVIESAVQCAPGGGDAYNSLAHVSLALGRHERANLLYRRAAELGPKVSRHWYNLASSERSLGRLEQAEAACNRAIALDSREHRAYLLRSEVRVQTAAVNHVEQLRQALARPDTDDRARVLLGYALGKELDDLGQYEEAFRCFALAADARRRQLTYDVASDERKVARIIEAFPRRSGPAAGARVDSSRFMFIVGLPRSGTTLVERILTGLPGVRSSGETENFERALASALSAGQGAVDQRALDVCARAATADWDAVAAAYARLADADACKLIIEKLPVNYFYLGAIHRALPHARLIVVNRAPVDVCFAMYRTLFGDAYPFTYRFEDLTRYYVAYSRLIAHWRDALGESIHEVHYEELVDDPVRSGGALARACGLEWRDSAVEVEKNSAVCLTQSAAQVRRPIYKSSAGSWRHYRAQLQPLAEALRARGVSAIELS